MKKIIPILTLVVGVGIGWGIATYQSRCALQEIQQTWTPEFRDIVEESYSIGKTMTEDERREQQRSVPVLAKKLFMDSNSQAYGAAFRSLIIKTHIDGGHMDYAISSAESCLDRFVKNYDNGDYKGDMNEEMAGKLAETIKTANKRTHSIANPPGDPVKSASRSE